MTFRLIHPRPLSWDEPQPARAEWICEDHKRLIIGDNRCPRCEIEQEQAAS